jgi:hypothetical protein
MARKGDRTVTGAYSADDGTSNPLADKALVKKSRGDTYGGYEHFSIGRTVNQKPNPGVQNRGNVQNGD